MKPLDKSQFMAVFKAEAKEHIAKLNQGFIRLEKNPHEVQVIDEIFRSAHTLKGSARMMGEREIHDIAHQLEDLLEKIKQGELKATPSLTDQALKAVDIIEKVLQEMGKNNPSLIDVTEVCQALNQYITEKSESSEEGPSGPKLKIQAISEHKGSQESKSSIISEKSDPIELEEYIRIPVSRVDTLLSLVGELMINKIKSSYKMAAFRQLTERVKIAQKRLAELLEKLGEGELWKGRVKKSDFDQPMHQCNFDLEELKRGILTLADQLSTETVHLDPVIDELQFKVKELRMMPCATIFEGLERLVRDVAREEKKEVELLIDGKDTELDKKVLEVLKPCLIHLLRNSVSHGIESPEERKNKGKEATGIIHLTAAHQGSRVLIEVSDDGRGVDLEQVKEVALKKHIIKPEELNGMDDREVMNLIFAPGFSTSPMITDISGRGVGLDVVRKEIGELKGEVSVTSQGDKGTHIAIKLPLTVAIMNILLVEAEGQTFGLPLLSVEEIVSVNPKDLETLENKMTIQFCNRTVPVIKLADVLQLPSKPTEEGSPKEISERWPVLIAHLLERRIGFLVDRLVGEEQIFFKNLGTHIGKLKNISGATLLGTGKVVLILDMTELILSARLANTSAQPKEKKITSEKHHQRILVVEDSLTTRELERGILQAQGYEVETAVDGMDGLAKLSQGKFNLIVSDVQMPRMDGFEFCKTLRQNPNYKELPFVFVTALEKEEEKRKGIEVGAQAYIVKGAFDQSNLLQAIDQLVG
ncbi:MAG: hybrid sensor histidine kinase/response regulator [Chlamydiae bacterium]|nr:hybrid sensor histidine kinase/response regulator [Chlamydiota bacterium]MBI3276708.1 hybrid sensor histidine kinase/response regulator [Chlamydiota bacterium]